MLLANPHIPQCSLLELLGALSSCCLLSVGDVSVQEGVLNIHLSYRERNLC
jgi:hypothetical protein